jgi:biopolymer transport protein ExbD
MAMGMNREGEGIHEINITPFVDIMLVLLIIFMVSTPAMVYRGLPVALPQTRKSVDLSHVTLNLTVLAGGDVYLDRMKLAKGDLANAVEKLRTAKVPVDALISADENATHGAVMAVAGELQAMGIAQVGFAVKK